MKKVFIRYNPYKLVTEIMVDDKKPAQNSVILGKSEPGIRLQEWIEDFPRLLVEEYNDTEFEVEFHGTLLDYDDLVSAFTEAHQRQELTTTYKRIPAKETSDKELLIDKVFNKIQKGPFDELRSDDVINAFKHAKSSDFEVCVVATMSAGKSTLINALLGAKLMPSKQEACTAIITRIKDISDTDVPWQAEVYGIDGQLIETHTELTYSTMDRLNADKNVSEIKITGNIPFVTSEDVSLVLVDTPGPNNSRDKRHGKVQSEFLGKSSKSLVIYIMTGEYGTNDDNSLLTTVSESMAVGGKQSKDRFIFVINKLDARKEEDGDTNDTLDRIRLYLKNHGISNPNLFPAAALPALNIRLIEKGTDVSTETREDTEHDVKKLNRNEKKHFETYASLPKSNRNIISQRVIDAKRDENVNEEALIHTGIPSIEGAISQYLQKYAKTAKIKNIVDAFIHKIEAVDCFEKTKRELAEHIKENDRIVEHIQKIQKKINDGELASEFKSSVDDAVNNAKGKYRKVINDLIKKIQTRVTLKVDQYRGQEIDIDCAKFEMDSLEKFAKKIEPEFEVELDNLIRTSLLDTGNALLEEYRRKLSSLAEEINISDRNSIIIDPLKLMGGSVVAEYISVNNLTKTKEIEDGVMWVPVPRKPILGLGLRDFIFGMNGEERVKYKTVEYIEGSELAQKYLAPLQDYLFENGEAAHKYAQKQSEQINSYFLSEFCMLDDVLKAKLMELENYATNQSMAEQRITETSKKLQWLKDIKDEVESILEI